MEKYIKITIDLKETKLSWNQLYKLYNVDEDNEPQDMTIGRNLLMHSIERRNNLLKLEVMKLLQNMLIRQSQEQLLKDQNFLE